MAHEKDDYQVGYGRPPRETRFAKGKSGNPKGRPKGSRNLWTLFIKNANELVEVKEGNRYFRKTRLEVVVLQMLNQAGRGEAAARRDCLGVAKAILQSDLSPEQQFTTRETEQKLVKGFWARQLRMNKTVLPELTVPSSSRQDEDDVEDICNVIP